LGIFSHTKNTKASISIEAFVLLKERGGNFLLFSEGKADLIRTEETERKKIQIQKICACPLL